MELLKDVVYIAPDGKRWTAVKGYKTNGATIPPILRSILGGSFDGQYREAAVIHDYYCFTKSITRAKTVGGPVEIATISNDYKARGLQIDQANQEQQHDGLLEKSQTFQFLSGRDEARPGCHL